MFIVKTDKKCMWKEFESIQLSNIVKHGFQTFIKLFHHSWQGEMSPAVHGYDEIDEPLVDNHYEVPLSMINTWQPSKGKAALSSLQMLMIRPPLSSPGVSWAIASL